MANIIKPKRSSVASKVPTTSDIVSGEIAVNSTDQKIYTNNGSAVVQIGAGKLSALGEVSITSPTTDQVLKYDGTNWVNASGGGGGVGGRRRRRPREQGTRNSGEGNKGHTQLCLPSLRMSPWLRGQAGFIFVEEEGGVGILPKWNRNPPAPLYKRS